MPDRVIVTGGAGFIGSHVVDALLAAGYEPVVVDDLSSGSRENLPADVRLHRLDIRDGDSLGKVFDQTRPRFVCHQAAQMSVSRSVREPLFDAAVNVTGLLNVFDRASRTGCERIVFASSGGVLYGDVSEPVAEDYPAAPVSPYGISKWVGEKYLDFYTRERGLSGVALRYSNVYGPRQNPHGEAGVVAIFCTRMLAAQPSIINGDGKYIRDYVYVGDVARANLLAMETSLPEAFVPLNIGTSRPTDVNELSQRLHRLCTEARESAELSGKVPKSSHGPARAGDLRSNLVSYAKAEHLLGWYPQVELESGLAHTVRWFAEHRPELV
ncbi:MAG: NAD-dependent epimerase/dehydratase family protein [Planctomycetes bacterium]|nr:NAD-dependent epimerase/dehydratase family protein [Planctomycetota bacterium]